MNIPLQNQINKIHTMIEKYEQGCYESNDFTVRFREEVEKAKALMGSNRAKLASTRALRVRNVRIQYDQLSQQ